MRQSLSTSSLLMKPEIHEPAVRADAGYVWQSHVGQLIPLFRLLIRKITPVNEKVLNVL